MLGFKKRFSILVILSTIGYALSFCNQLVISYYFGTSINLDAYWAALAIANFLCFYLHPLKEALVPATFRSSKISMEEASEMLSAGIILLTLLVGISALILFLSPNILAEWISSGAHSDQYLLDLLPWFIPFLFLFTFSETLNHILLGFNKNLTQATSRIVAGAASLVTLILLSAQFGIKAMVISLSVYQLVVVVISLWALLSLQLKFKWTSVKILKTQHVFTLFGSLFISYLVAQLYVLIERNAMMQLSNGLLSSYQYSTSLVNMLLSMIAFPFANLLWNKFLNTDHLGDIDNALSILFRASCALFFILFPICVFAYLNAKAIIFIIYSRGAFDAHSLQMTAEAFKFTIFAAIPIGLSSVIGRYLISSKKSNYIAITGISIALTSIGVVLLSSYLNSIQLVLFNWLLGNLMGFCVCVMASLKEVTLAPEKINKILITLSQSILLILVTAFLSPDFTQSNTTKVQSIINLSYNFIIYIFILFFLAKISGVARKIESIIFPNAS